MSGFARVLGAVGLKVLPFGVNRAGVVPDPGNDLSNAKALFQTGWATVTSGGDVTGPSSSVDSEVALFSGTGGKTIKRATGSGLAALTSGVLSLVTTWTGAALTGTAGRLAAFDGSGNPTTMAVGTSSGTVAAGDDSRITGAAQKASNLSDLANAGTARANLGLGTVATLASDTDGTLASNSDSKVATQKATKTYADTKASKTVSATQRVLGRNSAGSGDVEELTVTTLLGWMAAKRAQVLGVDPYSNNVAPFYAVPSGARIAQADGQNIRAIGCSVTVDGTNADTSDTAGQWFQISQSLTNLYSLRYGIGKFYGAFVLDAVIRTPGTINGRIWVGVCATLPSGNTDTLPNNSAWVAFRSGVDASNWGLVSRDGTTTATQVTVAAIATSTVYRVRLRYDGSSTLYGSVNGGAEVSLSSNLPASGTALLAAVAIAPNGSAHSIEINNLTVLVKPPAV